MTLIATCHCGDTRLELPGPPSEATSCNCSFCSKTGGLWAHYKPGEIKVLQEFSEAVYSASGFNQHHFCGRCGCSTYGISPDWQLGDTAPPEAKKWAINIRLIDDFDMATVPVGTIDGRNLW